MTMRDATVRWTTPAAGPAESMPLGNGVAGINLWVTPDGDIALYLALTGAYSENARLLKIGKLILRTDPALDASRLTWLLDPAAGEIRIQEIDQNDRGVSRGDEPGPRFAVRVWFELDAAVLHMDYESEKARTVSVTLDHWRTSEREIPREAGSIAEIHSAYGLSGAPSPVVVSPDTVFRERSLLAWCHHNRSSIWRRNMELQGLGDLCDDFRDPLESLTFGAVVFGDTMEAADAEGRTDRLATVRPRSEGRITVALCKAYASGPDAWLVQARGAAGVEELREAGRSARRAPPGEAAREYWRAFDERSFIRVGAAPDAERINTAYRLQRFLSAWAARGEFPIKFNGSLFTVDWDRDGEAFDPDYRRWGGHFWFQNTRLSYWPMLAAGDLQLMDSFFDFYTRLIPLAEERTRRYFGHSGVFFPETLTPWGTYAEDNYGWDRAGKHPSHVDNRYIRHYHQGTLELLTMALDRYAFSPDADFLERTLRPLAEAVIPFFDEHYERAEGRIRFYPSQSLETWQDAADPMPEIAGLWWTLSRLRALPSGAVSASLDARVTRMLGELPPIPLAGTGEDARLAAAAEIYEEKRNMENPELYAVFPYRLCVRATRIPGAVSAGDILPAALGPGAPAPLDAARRAYAARLHPRIGGWCQDGIQAAYLGLSDEAAAVVTDRLSGVYEKARFPVFWGPNYDWIPDQDHGSVITMTLQSMLLQYDGDSILLFPAWPRNWDVHFRLHAPGRTTVEARLEAGRLIDLSVAPEGRREDLVLPADLS